MLRFLDAANALSLVGLWAGLATALLAARGALAPALVALVAAGLCDFFDGTVARRLQRTEEGARFGARLDTTVDAIAFGLAPAVLLHAAGLRSPGELVLLGLYVACAAWRLAYFDAVGPVTQRGRRAYVGLPVTYAALVFPLAFLAGFAGPEALRWAAGGSCALMAFWMVAPIAVPKPGGAWYPILFGLGIVLMALYGVLSGTYPSP